MHTRKGHIPRRNAQKTRGYNCQSADVAHELRPCITGFSHRNISLDCSGEEGSQLLRRWWLIVDRTPVTSVSSEIDRSTSPSGGGLLEEQNMWFRLMNFVVLPSQTLSSRSAQGFHCALARSAYLCNTQASPFFLPEQFQCAFCGIKVISWDGLQHCLWKLHVSVFMCVVRVSEK